MNNSTDFYLNGYLEICLFIQIISSVGLTKKYNFEYLKPGYLRRIILFQTDLI